MIILTFSLLTNVFHDADCFTISSTISKITSFSRYDASLENYRSRVQKFRALPPTKLGLSPVGLFDDDSVLLATDFSAPVPDGIINIVYGILIIAILIAAFTTYISRSFVPEQMNSVALMVRDQTPEKWDEIQSKLNQGERVRDRPDLMAELVEAGIGLMKEETDEEMTLLINLLKKKGSDENTIIERASIESVVGCSIEDFVRKAETNADSQYMTDTRLLLAELLKQEFL
mmetsp:Transcript_20584/g.23619  ORF Transcript_20584/g.23619 Transcript_20584/m.23619 type:complete len:231 (-) Transcript_20584:84-776(-)